jgi:hypothetical protein
MNSEYKDLSSAEKSKGIPCRQCGAPITFSEDQRSPYTGKMIPLEMTGERHKHRSEATKNTYPNKEKVFERDSSNSPPPSEEEIWGSEEDIEF